MAFPGARGEEGFLSHLLPPCSWWAQELALARPCSGGGGTAAAGGASLRGHAMHLPAWRAVPRLVEGGNGPGDLDRGNLANPLLDAWH